MQPDSEDWRPLHPISPLLRAVQGLVIAVVIAFQSMDVLLDYPLIGAVVAGVVASVMIGHGVVSYYFTRYRMRPNNLDFREGVLFRSHRDVPFARLESVDIVQRAIPRVFGLAELRIEVAGAKDSDVRLRFLDLQRADALREQLLGARNASQETGSVDDSEEVLVIRADNRDVLLGYLLLPVVVPVLGFLLTVSVSTFVDPTVGLSVGFGGFFGVAAFVFAAARGLERVWGFRVLRTHDGFVVRRGLLSLLTQRIPAHRVQAVRVETPVTWRLINRSRLVVDVAGYQSGEGSERRETSVLLPIGKTSDIESLVDTVLPGSAFTEADLRTAPDASRFRVPYFWRSYRLGIDDRYSVTRHRVLREQLDIVPHHKVQSVRMTQGPWQRRLGLASVHYDTAGSNIAAVARHRSITEAEAIVSGPERAIVNLRLR